MPARSYSVTVRTTFVSPPKPLSQSATTGKSVARSLRTAASSASVIVVRFRSGRACAMVATPKPLIQTASKPYLPMSCAVSASWAPTATNGDGSVKPSRNAWRLKSAVSWLTVARLSVRHRRARDCTPRRAAYVRGVSCHEFLAGRLGVDATAPERVQQADDPLADLALGVGRHGPDMGRQDDVGQVPQRREYSLALALVNVQAGAADRPARE